MNAILLTNELTLNVSITRLKKPKVKLQVFVHIGSAVQGQMLVNFIPS